VKGERVAILVAVLVILFGAALEAQEVQRIPGPVAGSRIATAAATAAMRTQPFAVQQQREPGSWRSAVILGAVVAVVGGVVVASMDGDTKDRTTGDRVKSGVIGGLIIAVPVTVIFAMLSGGDDG
jgi:hypothetical protein